MDSNNMNTIEEPQLVNTLDETDKKCPSCGATMDFDPETGGLSCAYCGHTQNIIQDENVPSSAEELSFDSAEKTANCDWGKKTKTVICKACGAESIYDALAVSSECPYCGSNQVMEANDEDTIAPGGVVPFQVTDTQAADLFKKWIKRKWFCPKAAKESAKPGSFNGIYLPYWTFDANTYSRYSAQYGIDRRVRRGDQTVTVTDWHRTYGSYREFIDDHLVLASSRHDSGMLKGLEPFNTANNKAYKPEFIAGFTAERYSIGLKDAWETAKRAIKSRLTDNISRKVKTERRADHVKDIRFTPIYSNITYKYLMLPIWCANFKYNDKVYQFMVNGQTGKVSGKTPISALRVAIAVVICIIVILILFALSNI